MVTLYPEHVSLEEANDILKKVGCRQSDSLFFLPFLVNIIVTRCVNVVECGGE